MILSQMPIKSGPCALIQMLTTGYTGGEELQKAVRAAEQNRQAAIHALAEERQRSLELQVKISRQVCMELNTKFL